jgi:hypothetical protein
MPKTQLSYTKTFTTTLTPTLDHSLTWDVLHPHGAIRPWCELDDCVQGDGDGRNGRLVLGHQVAKDHSQHSLQRAHSSTGQQVRMLLWVRIMSQDYEFR